MYILWQLLLWKCKFREICYFKNCEFSEKWEIVKMIIYIVWILRKMRFSYYFVTFLTFSAYSFRICVIVKMRLLWRFLKPCVSHLDFAWGMGVVHTENERVSPLRCHFRKPRHHHIKLHPLGKLISKCGCEIFIMKLTGCVT